MSASGWGQWCFVENLYITWVCCGESSYCRLISKLFFFLQEDKLKLAQIIGGKDILTHYFVLQIA